MSEPNSNENLPQDDNTLDEEYDSSGDDIDGIDNEDMWIPTRAALELAPAVPAVVDASANELTAHGSRIFSRPKLDLLKRTVAQGTSDDEFDLFIEVVKLTGLNPFIRQIYAIMRNSREKDARGNWQTIPRMTIQTGIDGYRLLATRTEALAGIDDATFDADPDESWHPAAAHVTVWRFTRGQRVSFAATARWAEYAQFTTTEDGEKRYTSMWARNKMPFAQLAKCAEALALRKGFPAELSGIYTAEEMEQADNPTPAYDAHAGRETVRHDAAQTKRLPQTAGADASQSPAQASAPASASGAPAEQSWIPVRDPDVLKALRALRFTKSSEQHDTITALRTQFHDERKPWTKEGLMALLRERYRAQVNEERRAKHETQVDQEAQRAQEDAAAKASGYDLRNLPSGAGAH